MVLCNAIRVVVRVRPQCLYLTVRWSGVAAVVGGKSHNEESARYLSRKEAFPFARYVYALIG